MSTLELIKDINIAPIAGFVATKAMEPVSMALYNMESKQDREREDAVRPGAPYTIAAKKTLGILGIELGDDALETAGMIFHYGLAISWAPVYSMLRRSTRMHPIAAGLTTGAAMSLVVDEGITPMLGFSAPNRAYPPSTHLRGFAAHLVFGLALAAVTEAAWAISGRRP